MNAGGLFEDPERLPTSLPQPPREDAPLAERLRPTGLDEVLGQEHLLGKEGPLRRAFEKNDFPSLIFWGPPGTGKTTLALLLARRTGLVFRPFSAVLSGIKEVREAMQEAKRLRHAAGRRTLLFVDEIHRFNKAQQDAFLPFVERGDILLVGATTENPSFEVIGPLLSRVTVYVLHPLREEDLVELLERALADRDRGLGARGNTATREQLLALARFASGDARRALNALEAVVRQLDVGQPVREEALDAVFQGRALLYDKEGEQHFDLISALHKSVRCSDPDAALYWLERMLVSGEDPLYLARRMVRMASEDIGLADPNALKVALAARDAFHFLGSPEGELALAQGILYLSLAPKSNAVYRAHGEVRALLAKGFAHAVPLALRNAPTKLMKKLGWSKGQEYAHDDPEGLVAMECLPDALAGRKFYRPTGRGFEARIRKRLEEIRAGVEKRRAGERED